MIFIFFRKDGLNIKNPKRWGWISNSCIGPEVGIFTTESDSVQDLQQIYNWFSAKMARLLKCPPLLWTLSVIFEQKYDLVSLELNLKSRLSDQLAKAWLDAIDQPNINLKTSKIFLSSCIEKNSLKKDISKVLLNFNNRLHRWWTITDDIQK